MWIAPPSSQLVGRIGAEGVIRLHRRKRRVTASPLTRPTSWVPRRQACETWLPASCARWADLRPFGIAQLLLCRFIFVFEGQFVEIGLVAVFLVGRPGYRDGNTVVFNLSRLICCSE